MGTVNGLERPATRWEARCLVRKTEAASRAGAEYERPSRAQWSEGAAKEGARHVRESLSIP